MKQYIIYVNFVGYYFQYVLPTENNRTYEINVSDYINVADCKIRLGFFDNIWSIYSQDGVEIYDNNTVVPEKRISDGKVASGLFKKYDMKFSVRMELLSDVHLHFRKYDITDQARITLGSDPATADIVLNSTYISHEHAVIVRQSDGWKIEDHSKNGLYLNYQRMPKDTRVSLHLFDNIYTGGYHIIFLGNCIAINHSGDVTSRLPLFVQPPALSQAAPAEHLPFLRSPRMAEPLPEDCIEIEAPPTKNFRRRQPMLFVLGPALTTPLPMLVTMMLRMGVASNGVGTYWIMGVSVVLSAVIGLCWTLARKKYDIKEEKLTEAERVEAYELYLTKNEKLLADRHVESRKLLLQQYPSSEEINHMLQHDNLNSFLWNRNTRFNDFTSIRLGMGKSVIPGGIKIPKERFSVHSDELAERPAELKAKYELMSDIPALSQLREHKLIGIIGEKNNIDGIANNIALQLASQHSYTDVRMAFLYDKSESSNYEWARWLPHTFSPDKKVRMMGSTEDTQQNVLAYLSDVLRRRAAEENGSQNASLHPMYVVFCTQPALLYNHSVYQYLTAAEDFGFCFVLVYERMDLLPNECTYLIQADNQYNGFYSLDASRDQTNMVQFEYIKPNLAEQAARKLSTLWINEISDGEIPERIDFLEMYGISDLKEWNLIKRWKESRTYENIRAQIGVTYGRHPVYLDIHEKQHGPHGLVAGTTGSGKSETIQTFILSLMMNYSPDEVAFILIDYKGGGMANLFNGTPHVAGTITNLAASSDDDDTEEKPDTNQTQRALASLKSEIKRRQKIFKEHSVNHIDLYNRLYREGSAKDPLPHLIIISDEFAELKKEQPEFIKELVSTARVGRSLGIHLILATQKPSGVVDDEIWSNSRFKLCLKVQDRQDSMEMLKRPEAAELTRTGQGYLQVGNDESFEMFQSGYSGADYRPDRDVSENKNNSIELVTLDGIHIKHNGGSRLSEKISQLDACVKFIQDTARANGIRNTRSLWLPMLTNSITFESLAAKLNLAGSYTAVVGKIDYPEQQSQPLFTLKYPQCGHTLVIGNAGSGKSVLMKTILYSLCMGQSPEQFNWYALDFSNHAFDKLKYTPHCGGIAHADEDEKIKRMFLMLSDIIQKRKKQLVEAGMATAEEYRAKMSEPMPLILVLLDNFAGFMESYERFTENLLKLLREGIQTGVHFLVSINAASDMRSKLAQNFTTSIPLLLNERSDYYNYLGSTPHISPLGWPGSGLSVYNGSHVQFQAAFVEHPEELEKKLEGYSGFRAKQLRFINRSQTYEEYLEELPAEDRGPYVLPLGWNAANITTYSVSLWNTFCYAISDAVGSGMRSMVANILYYLDQQQIELHYVGGESDFDLPSGTRIYSRHEQVFDLMSDLREIFKERVAARKAYIAEKGSQGCDEYMQAKFKPVAVLFGDYNAFCSMTYQPPANSDVYTEAFEAFLKNGKGYGVTFFAVWNKQIYSQNFMRPACQLFMQHKAGVHLGGKLDAQKLVDTNMSLAEQARQRPAESGFAVSDLNITEVYIPPHLPPRDDEL